VAAFFAPDGSLTINHGTPSGGRAAIKAAALNFMSTFPDLVVTMDGLTMEGPHVKYHWTLTGTHAGSGETRKSVRIRVRRIPFRLLNLCGFISGEGHNNLAIARGIGHRPVAIVV
jgi:hypothetical protein